MAETCLGTYVFKQLPMLQARPDRLQKHVFDRLFQVAEVARPVFIVGPDQTTVIAELINDTAWE